MEIFGERYIDARSEQVWLMIDDTNCLARWLSFAQAIEVIDGNGLGRRQVVHGRFHPFCNGVEQEITQYEPARLVCWTHTGEHPSIPRVPRFDRTTTITVRLIPEGAGTRVRIEGSQEPAGLLRGLALRMLSRRSLSRHIRLSLERLDGIVKGRIAA